MWLEKVVLKCVRVARASSHTQRKLRPSPHKRMCGLTTCAAPDPWRNPCVKPCQKKRTKFDTLGQFLGQTSGSYQIGPDRTTLDSCQANRQKRTKSDQIGLDLLSPVGTSPVAAAASGSDGPRETAAAVPGQPAVAKKQQHQQCDTERRMMRYKRG